MDWTAVYGAQDDSLDKLLARGQVQNSALFKVAQELQRRKEAERQDSLTSRQIDLQADNAKETRAFREMQQQSLNDDRAQRAADRAAAQESANTQKFYNSLPLRKKGSLVTPQEQVRFVQENLTGDTTAAGADEHMADPHFHFAGTPADEVAQTRQANDEADRNERNRHNKVMEDLGRTNAGARPSAVSPNGGLSPDAVDYTAAQYRILGPSGIPTRIGEADRVNILNAAAAQGKALGQSPVQTVQRQAAFKADAASLNQMTKMSDAARSYETKAQEQAKKVLELSPTVPRTASPMLNDWLLSGKANVAGDPNVSAYFNAIQTFSTEYAKIMEGSTGSVAASTEGSRKAAERLIHSSQSPEQIARTVALMQWEMDQTLKGYDVTIEHITERMHGGGGVTPGAAGTGTGAAPATPSDAAQSPNLDTLRSKYKY